jgi:hypothetical protein
VVINKEVTTMPEIKDVTIENLIMLNECGFAFIVENGQITTMIIE